MTLRRVTADTDITWDGGQQHLSRGTILAVEPGSSLETAIGTGNLADLSDPVAAAAAAEQAGASN
jgi:hypothetical protein